MVVIRKRAKKFQSLLILVGLLMALPAWSAVLPEERSDVMYHSYDGGGVTIDGPSVLLRKNIKDTVSISANYYVDTVSSASIDVVASGASEYTEERKEYSVTAAYLSDKTLLSGGITNSKETDYTADTFYFNVSQDFFGDLSTVSLGYSRGNDEVRQNGNEDLQEQTDRQNYRFGLSQILTPNLLMSLSYEAVTEEGFLNNPYRSYRFLTNPADPQAGFQTATEVYPRTRTSDAATLSASYYLKYGAALKAEYRYYTDDWDIDAHTYQLTYTHTFGDHWTVDVRYRAYNQTAANFYQDLFDFAAQDDRDFRARDKELSEFSTQTFGVSISYEIPWFKHKRFTDRASLNLKWDHIMFDYDNFRDITPDGAAGSAVGEEPLYNFDADVIRLFFSVWY